MRIVQTNLGVKKTIQMKNSKFRQWAIGKKAMLCQTNHGQVRGDTWTRDYELPGSIAFGTIQRDESGMYVKLNEAYGGERIDDAGIENSPTHYTEGFLMLDTIDLPEEVEPAGLEDVFNIQDGAMLPKSQEELAERGVSIT